MKRRGFTTLAVGLLCAALALPPLLMLMVLVGGEADDWAGCDTSSVVLVGGTTDTVLSEQQLANAGTIVSMANDLGMPSRAVGDRVGCCASRVGFLELRQ